MVPWLVAGELAATGLFAGVLSLPNKCLVRRALLQDKGRAESCRVMSLFFPGPLSLKAAHSAYLVINWTFPPLILWQRSLLSLMALPMPRLPNLACWINLWNMLCILTSSCCCSLKGFSTCFGIYQVFLRCCSQGNSLCVSFKSKQGVLLVAKWLVFYSLLFMKPNFRDVLFNALGQTVCGILNSQFKVTITDFVINKILQVSHFAIEDSVTNIAHICIPIVHYCFCSEVGMHY